MAASTLAPARHRRNLLPLATSLQKEVWASCRREGMAYRLFGKRLEECPRFIDADMEVSWRSGWREKDKEISSGR